MWGRSRGHNASLWDDERFGIHQWVATGERLARESFGHYREQGGSVIIHSRTEEMTRAAVENPLTMIASDGGISNGRGHPRGSGTYSRVLGQICARRQSTHASWTRCEK